MERHRIAGDPRYPATNAGPRALMVGGQTNVYKAVTIA
jgi:hypothetical protein